MGISVVIPVFNAEEFVREAVLSALIIPEVQQIILVEDTSPDNCLKICQDLVREFPHKVELHRHPEGTRQGAAASRNLGIKKAIGKYIAFLDADDYYLPQRFVRALQIFNHNPFVDYVVSPSQLEADYKMGNNNYTMMNTKANNPAYNLFPALLTEGYGYFDTNSIIIRHSSLKRLTTLFDTRLELHQDSELWLRIAYKLRGVTENKTLPGSVVRRHINNRIIHRNANSLSLYWRTVFTKFNQHSLSRELNWFIKLKKKYYKHRSAGSLLSYWYWLGIQIFDSYALQNILQPNALNNRYYLPENEQELDNTKPQTS